MPDWWINKARAKVYFAMQRPMEALQDLRTAFELNPRDLSTLVWIPPQDVAACPNQQFQNGLLQLANDAVAHPDTDKASAHQYRVQLLAALKRWTQAIDDYTWLIEQQPDQPAHRLNRAKARRATGDEDGARFDFDACLTSLDRAIAAQPDDWQGWNLRGLAYFELERHDEALADFGKAAELAPANWRVEYDLALCALAVGDAARYRQACARLVQSSATFDDAQQLRFLAWTCALAPAALDDYAPALAWATKSVELEPEKPQAQNTLAALLHRAGRHQEALDRLIALEKQQADPNSDPTTSPAYTWYLLALTHHSLEHAETAKDYLAKANARTDQELAHKDNPPVWNRRVTLELLRKEAEALIGKPADSPVSEKGQDRESDSREVNAAPKEEITP
jgi:superkiller protein 3